MKLATHFPRTWPGISRLIQKPKRPLEIKHALVHQPQNDKTGRQAWIRSSSTTGGVVLIPEYYSATTTQQIENLLHQRDKYIIWSMGLVDLNCGTALIWLWDSITYDITHSLTLMVINLWDCAPSSWGQKCGYKTTINNLPQKKNPTTINNLMTLIFQSTKKKKKKTWWPMNFIHECVSSWFINGFFFYRC